MEELKWNDSRMSVDIKLIDDQHKELLKIINTLATSINDNSQKRDILIIVDKLIEYTKYHFSTEEVLFEKFNFDKTDSHKAEHAEFIQTFTDIRLKLTDYKYSRNKLAVEISQKIFTYLTTWFVKHVTGTDREYIELFKENNVK